MKTETDSIEEAAECVEMVDAAPLIDDIGCAVQPNSIEIIRAGQKALERLSRCLIWQDWTVVGEALLVIQEDAMRAAQCDKPEGYKYNAEFSRRLKENGFDEIDKSVRSRLLKCLKHREEIEEWRATLTTSEKLELNHPAAVLRRWQKTIVARPADAPKKAFPVAKLKASIADLEEDNYRMRREIEHGGDDNLWTPEDTAEVIARTIFDKVSPPKARAIAQHLLQLADSEKQLH